MTYSSSLHILGTNCPETGGESSGAKITKAIFEEYAGELTKNDPKVLISKLKEHKLSYLVFYIRFPFGIELILNGKITMYMRNVADVKNLLHGS